MHLNCNELCMGTPIGVAANLMKGKHIAMKRADVVYHRASAANVEQEKENILR